ncbi:hypothetical protein BTO30_01560 [Domibacillus antri]|uniref:HEPN domain-containing protein n=1 Tax=Domibacillus antri TaxID=1714264 RepID=A0A1Q8Q9V0_9BACI|nr:hypothetical protein [Domibacillus antri]OLN24126.1 hypothetical protein BTO30_01560 [Domibacillus antri]
MDEVLTVKRKELEKSFRRHLTVYRQAGGTKSQSHRLLLFYGIECGLKALLIRNIKKDTTAELFDYFESENGRKLNGHDLKELLLFFRKIPSAPQFNIKSFPNFPCHGNQAAPVSKYNEVWRYGIDSDSRSQKDAEEILIEIASQIEEELV